MGYMEPPNCHIADFSTVFVDRRAQNGPQPETAVTHPIILQHTEVISRIYFCLERIMVL